MLRFIYNRFKHRIWDLLVEDFYGYIPADLREPSLEFLALGKEKLEKAWSIQAYQMQRRSIMDNKNADVYKGMLIILRAQLLILEKGGKVKYEKPEPAKEVVDPSAAVEDFVKKGKARFEKKA